MKELHIKRSKGDSVMTRFKVITKRGAVTLYGKARTASELNMVTKLAKDVSGVKSVKNRMSIK